MKKADGLETEVTEDDKNESETKVIDSKRQVTQSHNETSRDGHGSDGSSAENYDKPGAKNVLDANESHKGHTEVISKTCEENKYNSNGDDDCGSDINDLRVGFQIPAQGINDSGITGMCSACALL